MDRKTRDRIRIYILDRIEFSGSGCWEWKQSLKNGYGQAHFNKNAYAHRLSYMAFVGDIPSGMQVCHKCDNRKCCNPEHLWIGTNADNVADMIAKGRNSPPPITPRPGEKSPNAKLKANQVREIRERYKRGGVSQAQLGAEYGVHQMSISRIVRRTRWATE